MSTDDKALKKKHRKKGDPLLKDKSTLVIGIVAIVAIAGIIGGIVILTLFMLREIYPNNPFIMKYFNKGYLVMEVLLFFGILWGIDIWIAHRREKRKREK